MRARRLTCTFVGILLLAARTATAQATGTITGTITDALSAPLANVRVTLYNEAGGFAPTDFTDALGRFEVPGLAPGIYYAQASLEPEYPLTTYGAICDPYCNYPVSGTPIVVQASQATVVSFSLTRAGRISGRMTNADTGAVEGGSVTAYDSSGFWVTYNNANFLDGTYEIGGLRPGRYYLLATNSSDDVNLSELYGGLVCDFTCDVTQGVPVDVVSGQVISGIDFALDLGGSIAGVVTSAATGLPVSGILVFARDRRTGETESAEPSADGTYRIARLEAGTHSVWAQSFSANYANQLYGGLPILPRSVEPGLFGRDAHEHACLRGPR